MLKNNFPGFSGRFFLVAVSIALSATSSAEPIKVNSAALYASDAVGTAQLRSTCSFDRQIIDSLVHYSRHRVEVTGADLSTVAGKTIKVLITSVHVAGGGGFSGPKWGTVRVQLMDNGELLTEFNVNVSTTSGRWTACETADRIARVLGARAAKRLLTLSIPDKARSNTEPDDHDQADEQSDDKVDGKTEEAK